MSCLRSRKPTEGLKKLVQEKMKRWLEQKGDSAVRTKWDQS